MTTLVISFLSTPFAFFTSIRPNNLKLPIPHLLSLMFRALHMPCLLIRWSRSLKWPQSSTALWTHTFCSVTSYQEMKTISPPFASGLALGLDLINTVQRKLPCASSEFQPQKGLYVSTRSVGNLPVHHVSNPRIPWWRMRDHEERKWAVPADAILSQQLSANPLPTHQLSVDILTSPRSAELPSWAQPNC